MKSFNLKRSIGLLVLIFFLWWDSVIIRDFLDFNAKKSHFNNLELTYKNLNKEIEITDHGDENSMINSLQQIQNNLYQNIRVRFQDSEFLSFVAKIASSMDIKEVNPSMIKSANAGKHGNQSWEKIRVKIRFRSRYHEAARFLNLLEKSPYLTEIMFISMQRGSKDPTGPAFIVIDAIYYKLR